MKKLILKANHIILTPLIFFFIIGFSFASLAQKNDQGDMLIVGDKVPDFNIVKADGSQLKFSELKGKYVFIVFFATWCGPCNAELPHVQEKIWNEFKDNNNVEILIFGRGHTNQELIDFSKSKGYSMPMIADKDRKVFDLFAKLSIPRTYIVGKDGKILKYKIGFSDSSFDMLKDYFTDLLK